MNRTIDLRRPGRELECVFLAAASKQTADDRVDHLNVDAPVAAAEVDIPQRELFVIERSQAGRLVVRTAAPREHGRRAGDAEDRHVLDLSAGRSPQQAIVLIDARLAGVVHIAAAQPVVALGIVTGNRQVADERPQHGR